MRKRRAFTLVELLVVFAIISVLAGFLLPVLGQVQKTAKSTSCVSNEKQLFLAFTQYADDNENLLPPTCAMAWAGGAYFNGYGKWTNFLGPYVGLDDVGPVGNPPGANPMWLSGPKYGTVFHCPSFDYRLAGWSVPVADFLLAGYGMNKLIPPKDQIPGAQWQRVYHESSNISRVHKPSRCVLVADSTSYNGELGTNWDFGSLPPACYYFDYLRHMEGTNVLYCDGHVEYLSASEVLARKNEGTLFLDE